VDVVNVNAGLTMDSRRTLPEAMRPTMWRQGQSGNPGGVSNEFKECQAFCREKSRESAEAIARIADSTTDERLAFMAHQWIYERAWGKPKDFNPKDEPDPNKPRFDPRLLSPQQLEVVQYALRLMVQATRAPGDVETVIEQGPDEPSEDADPGENIQQVEEL
jgi:hypothetical protein